MKILPWMGSAVSTEAAEQEKTDRGEGLYYEVPRPVKVRKETFGLLFYDTKESRLTFVRSGDLLQIRIFQHGRKMISAGVKPESRAKVKRLLDHLLEKRLIRES